MASLPKLHHYPSFQRSLYIQKPDDFRHPAFLVAESEGFEPPDPLRSTVFKTAAFDHSANSPICFPRKGFAKVDIFSNSANFFAKICNIFSFLRLFDPFSGCGKTNYASFEKYLYLKSRR